MVDRGLLSVGLDFALYLLRLFYVGSRKFWGRSSSLKLFLSFVAQPVSSLVAATFSTQAPLAFCCPFCSFLETEFTQSELPILCAVLSLTGAYSRVTTMVRDLLGGLRCFSVPTLCPITDELALQPSPRVSASSLSSH